MRAARGVRRALVRAPTEVSDIRSLILCERERGENPRRSLGPETSGSVVSRAANLNPV